MAVSDQIRYKKEATDKPTGGSAEDSGDDNSVLAFFQSRVNNS